MIPARAGQTDEQDFGADRDVNGPVQRQVTGGKHRQGGHRYVADMLRQFRVRGIDAQKEDITGQDIGRRQRRNQEQASR
ncbi:hypothetical protein EV216_11025 [Rhodovulum steppense]|uniref:Uncharacterized protein n=1 Tax=Rhodovulum steppense TaxID=540251 RepID=A0A4R1YUE5_9RHOB|nr:hypothetical protein EV216_11025 [Rhodovulum steppense]